MQVFCLLLHQIGPSQLVSRDHLESTVFFPFRFYDRKILNVGFDLKYIDKNLLTDIQYYTKGGFKSEDTEEFFHFQIDIPNHYPEQKI